MKKISIGALAGLIALGFAAFTPKPNVKAAEFTQIYRGEQVEQFTNLTGVWQSSSVLNSGASSLYYCLEKKTSGSNMFLRMTDFDGYGLADFTAVNLRPDKNAGDATISFRYRLCEEEGTYREDDPVFSLSQGSQRKIFTYAELKTNASDDFSWNELSFDWLSAATEQNSICLTFHYTDAEGAGYFDIDDIAVNVAGENVFSLGDFEFAEADEGSSPIYSFDPATEGIEAKKQYMLNSDSMVYSVNTEYSDARRWNFDFGQASAMLARAGSSGTYRGSTSVNAGEGDVYAVYDSYSDNTFVRLGNFNGKSGVTGSRFVSYFYDADTGSAVTSLPGSGQIRYSFDYRLYIDDPVLAGLRENDAIFTLTVKGATSDNNGGVIRLGDLIVNERGDESWHTYSGVWQAKTSASPYLMFQFDGHDGNASFSTNTFADIDNVNIGKSEGDSRLHLRGTFEGMAADEMQAEQDIAFNSAFGTPARKVAKNSLNGAMRAEAGESFSVHTDFAKQTNVYHVSFLMEGKEGAVGLYFSGRSGRHFSLTAGKDGESEDGALSVAWSEEGGMVRCDLYVALTLAEGLRSLTFVNEGSSPFVIDEVFVGQVASVNATAGDFASYETELLNLHSQYESEREQFTDEAQRALSRAFCAAQSVTAYHSGENMAAALEEVRSLLSSSGKKADLSALQSAIEDAQERIRGYSQKDFTKSSWLTFYDVLTRAMRTGEETEQEQADALCDELIAATKALEEVNSVSVPVIAAAGGIAGGGAIVGTVALVRKRRKV